MLKANVINNTNHNHNTLVNRALKLKAEIQTLENTLALVSKQLLTIMEAEEITSYTTPLGNIRYKGEAFPTLHQWSKLPQELQAAVAKYDKIGHRNASLEVKPSKK